MAKQETIADIIAEMHRVEVCADGKPCLRDYARRFEAAHKREVQNALDAGGFVEASRKNKQVGNAAKLREALVQVQKKINYLIGNLTVPNSLVANRMEFNGIINAALAAPPRNCDRFATKFDAEHEWERVCKVGLPEQGPFEDWIFSPVTEKEGGNDAD